MLNFRYLADIPSSLTIFFDGGCPVCSREINHYRKLEALTALEWIDVTLEPERLVTHEIPLLDAMAEFHVMDETGQFHKGADGFLLLWSTLPYYRYLAAFFHQLHLEPLLRDWYTRFARWHFRRRCPNNRCRINT